MRLDLNRLLFGSANLRLSVDGWRENCADVTLCTCVY